METNKIKYSKGTEKESAMRLGRVVCISHASIVKLCEQKKKSFQTKPKDGYFLAVKVEAAKCAGRCGRLPNAPARNQKCRETANKWRQIGGNMTKGTQNGMHFEEKSANP